MALATLAAFLFAPSALAGTVTNDRPLLFTFDGADTSIGLLSAPSAIALDEATGTVYVNHMAGEGKGPGEFDAQRVVCKFNAEGEAQNFTAGSSAGKSCLDGEEVPGGAFGVAGRFEEGAFTADIAVDNSGGAGGPGEGEQGRLYVSEEGGPVHAFAPDGAYLWTLARTTASPCGIAVDAEGHLWVGNGGGSGEARFEALEFDNQGSPPAQIGSFDTNPTETKANGPCRLAIDLSGKNLYVGLHENDPSGADKYVEGKYHSSFSAGYRFDVTIDQSQLAGHIFMSDGESFEEYKPCTAPACAGIPEAGSPFGRDLIGTARGIAYNPALDWVYVSDVASDTVKVFGPLTSGTVPDVTSEETEAVGLHTATAKGTINPLSLPNSYHFEWKPGTEESWGAAESSPPQSIEPSDSSPHPVSFAITEYKGKALKSNTTYQVRLVATNTENGLDAYAGADTFTTLVPPIPIVEHCATSAISTESAHLECDVDPQEEEVTWKVLASAQTAASKAECEALSESQFQVVKEGTIPAEEPGSVEIEADLSGLLAAQTYCVRVIATNPGGSGKEDLTFTTLAIAPGEAAAAFAAPRTDTSARINARVNPNGEADLSYRFELSEDGATWTPLPTRTSTIDAREPILVAEELTGLAPDTEYHYRFWAENEAGEAPSLGTVKTFTTRASAEVQAAESLPSCPNEDIRAAQQTEHLGSCRGLELVSNPDKGNQSPFASGPYGTSQVISEDGEKVLWWVSAGAPGAPNGTENQFLAERSPGGWRSESVNPPVEKQVGGGELRYRLDAATPDFKTFVFAVKLSAGLAPPPAPTVVRVREGVQDVLKSYEADPPNNIYEESIEVSEDGEHVLFLDGKTNQLEDIGAARVGPPAVGAEVVSLMPDDLPSACGLDAFGGESFAQGNLRQPGYRWAAASDASRVYFRAPANGDCGGLYRLWVRDREAGTTTEIDPGALGESPEFIRASADGRSAYFLTRSDLDPEDTDEDLTGPERDVYRWEEEAGESSCLTCVVPDANLAGDPAGGVAAALVSDDFSHVYFQSKARLEGEGTPGNMNIYVLSGGEIVLAASVDTGEDMLERSRRPGLSVDGKVLLFKAPAGPSMTADPLAAQCILPEEAVKGKLGPCTELYRYDDRDASLECLSCRHGAPTTHSVGSPGRSGEFSYRLSGDGSTVGFVSAQALLEADVNQDTDVYEWRNGHRSLISDGVSEFQGGNSAPQVMALDADGSDLIFGLVPPGGRLTGFERDGVLNIYDARIGGGFMPPPAPPETCKGDNCQGPLQAAPAHEVRSSATHSGPGNLAKKRPCAKKRGKAKRRCLRKHRRRAGQARRGRAR